MGTKPSEEWCMVIVSFILLNADRYFPELEWEEVYNISLGIKFKVLVHK